MKIRPGTTIMLAAALLLLTHGSAMGGGTHRLQGHVPEKMIAKSQHLGRHQRNDKLSLAIALKPRDPEAIADLITRLYDPSDSQYHQFLTPAQFKERYAPSEEDVNQVVQYFGSHGLRVTKIHGNNLVVDFEASTSAVEDAFQLEVHDYAAPDGRRVHAPNREPLFSDEIGAKVVAVNGLSSFALLKHVGSHHTATRLDPSAALGSHASVGSYMTPTKIRSAYNVTSSSATGAGETVALFQLDGYKVSDITSYASYFSLTVPTLVNVLVDGATGSDGSDSIEVCLDIEMVMAMAPGVSKIMVYEGPNTDSGVVDTYSKIATDNIAKEVSTSWGLAENEATANMRNSENAIFQQMVLQGQAVFAASGDNGAYDDSTLPTQPEVDDPASQPFVTAVGGTTLTLNSSNNYVSESSWGTGSEGSGGGISSIWPIPSWQKSMVSSNSELSSVYRMVPDVSLDANPSTGYPVFNEGAWYAVGGTSASAPLWAAFMAIVNQSRVNNGLSRLGFANNAIYQLGQSSVYSSAFHDVADGSTNLKYHAVAGYDLSTGWGSINGTSLLAALANALLPPYPPAVVGANSQAGQVVVTWSAASGASSYNVLRSTSLNGSYSVINSSPVTATSYSDVVAPGNYYYLITATNSAGTSGASSKVGGSPNLTAPGAPSGLSAQAVQ